MPGYSHKKSLRHVTDEQFSEGTTVDGNRIDAALDDAVEHINNIPPGDVVSRFTETKHVFGYRPARNYVGTLTQTPSTYYYAHHFPWMQIANNRDLVGSGGSDGPSNPFTAKGVHLDDLYNVPNSGPLPYPTGAPNTWAADLAANIANPAGVAGLNDYTSNTAAPGAQNGGPLNGYQYAWTMAYKSRNACIIDDLMVAFTIDGDSNLGDISGTVGSNAQFQNPTGTVGTSSVSVVMMVDSHFAPERRDQADIEVAAHRYDLRGFKYTATTLGATVAPMLPSMKKDDLSESRIMRWRDLNIPVHAGARIRLMITLPWTTGGHKPDGLTYESLTEIRTAPFFYFSPRGCMTVLEEVVE